MRTLNLTVKAIMVIGLSLGLMACDSKKDSKPNMRGAMSGNRTAFVNNDGNYIPGGSPMMTQQCPNCGSIYVGQSQYYDFRSTLLDFLLLNDAPNEIGNVSGQQGANTGVYFEGEVDAQLSYGSIDIAVWDSIANDTGQAYVVSMSFDAANPANRLDNQGATVAFADGSGVVIFNGNWNNDGTYSGTVSYTNNGQSTRQLGNFHVGGCSLIRCP